MSRGDPLRVGDYLGHIVKAPAQNFPTRNSYRSRAIAEILKSLGFVNRFGYGAQRAQALLADNGNPPAVFEFDAHLVLVKIYSGQHEATA